MFNNQKLIDRTLEEIENDEISTTYDEVLEGFIDYIIKLNMACNDMTFLEAFDHMNSDDFKDEFSMYMDFYLAKHHKPKYSPDDLVIIPREQLDQLVKASNR